MWFTAVSALTGRSGRGSAPPSAGTSLGLKPDRAGTTCATIGVHIAGVKVVLPPVGFGPYAQVPVP